MFTAKNYVRAESLEQAYQLNRKKQNRLVGGMLWLKMSRLAVDTAIDLSALGLDTVEETETHFHIGCMTTLRTLETHAALNAYTGGAFRECVKNIVGTAFRNLATVGGSVYSRFGFSDPLTLLAVLDTSVELYKGGEIPLADFLTRPHDRDILVRVNLRKQENLRCAYLSVRGSRTDFPVLTASASVWHENGAPFGKIAIGARPHIAYPLAFDPQAISTPEGRAAAAKSIAAKTPVYGNMRAGADYRKHLARVLAERAFEALAGVENQAGNQTERSDAR